MKRNDTCPTRRLKGDKESPGAVVVSVTASGIRVHRLYASYDCLVRWSTLRSIMRRYGKEKKKRRSKGEAR